MTSRGGSRRMAPYLLLLPSTLFFAVLFLWPMVQGLLLSLQGPEGAATGDHFRRMLAEPQFWPSVRNTFLIVVVVVPLQFALALAMGLILQSRPRMRGLLLYVWAVPLAVSDLAAGLVWLSVFADNGYLNSVLVQLGLERFSWLSYQNPQTMFLAIVVAEVWRATALVFVIIVAGLQVIPKEFDEAAQVFAASYWQRLRHVTLPLLRPSLQVALILRTILAFQAFAVVQALTGDNYPVLVGETYEWYAELQNSNVAAALAVVIMAISMVWAIVYLRLLRQPEAMREVRA
jgi:multiple sugar transport system permease protein